MKLQLIKAPITDLPAVDRWYMPLELISLANSVHDVCEVEILDGTLLSKEEIIKKIDADIAGITFTSLSVSNAKEIAEIAKSKNSFVVFGGQAASANPDGLFQIPETDAVIVHGGETSLRTLIENNLKNLEKVPNLHYRQNQNIENTFSQKEPLDKFYTILDRKKGGLNIEDYINSYHSSTTFPHIRPSRPTNIFSQRGCPRTCSFCARQDKEHTKRDPKNVVNEIAYLKKEFKIDYLFDISDTWAKDENWMKDFLNLYDAENIPMTVFADIRDIIKEKLNIMRKCGIDHILFGVESGSEEILKNNGKFYTREKIVETIAATVDSGIKVSASFVVGLLGENKKTLSETESLVPEIVRFGNVHPYVNIIIPLPGSRLWAKFVENEQMKSKYGSFFNYDLDEARMDFLKEQTSLKLYELEEFRDRINLCFGLEKTIEYAR
jgi:anaerobic magnesium-protoporphyrin IX monomethyl ester cyclase